MEPPRLTHVRVNVRDLARAVDWYERLLGVAADGHWPPDAWWARVGPVADVLEPIFDTPYGTRKFTIRDPDGNELGFVQA